MSYPLVQFVAAPEVDAGVRFDFNDGTAWPTHDAFDLGVPSLEGDPDGIGVEYGLRELSFNLLIEGDKGDAVAKQNGLARELLRQTNWLLFQIAPEAAPVWFKTYRTQPGEMSLSLVDNDDDKDYWQIGVSLAADPFAYGERVTLPAVTIKNDPAATTYPMTYDLPEILGDAPAPLTIWADKGNVTNLPYPRFMFAVSADPGAFAVLNSSAMTAYTGADAADTASSAYSGGSYRRVVFTDNTMQIRAGGPMPISRVGRYKILARVSRSDTSSTFELRGVTNVATGASVMFDRASTTASGFATWVDLGEFGLPFGVNDAEVDRISEAASFDPNDVSVYLQARRLTGAGDLRIDAFMAIPVADTRALKLAVDALFLATVRVDGPTEQIAWMNTAGKLTRFLGLARGDFPHATPGRANRLYVFHNVYEQQVPSGTWDNTDTITETLAVTVGYVPRYLYLAGA